MKWTNETDGIWGWDGIWPPGTDWTSPFAQGLSGLNRVGTVSLGYQDGDVVRLKIRAYNLEYFVDSEDYLDMMVGASPLVMDAPYLAEPKLSV